MSLGKRGPDEKQEPMWIEAARLATPAGHPFYERLNRLLSKRGFDAFVLQLLFEVLRSAVSPNPPRLEPRSVTLRNYVAPSRMPDLWPQSGTWLFKINSATGC